MSENAELVRATADYLTRTPRQLPSYLLYDALGSSLFDAICQLPWYGVTRAELGLLARHGSELAAAVVHPVRIVELGCGNGDKLLALVRALAQPETLVELIDVSEMALERSSLLARGTGGVHVRGHRATYEEGLAALPAPPPGTRTLAAFLGSNIGNFHPPEACELLARIRARLAAGDYLLLGADLAKPEAVLLDAYDDPLGVTAAFNRNLLVRLNAELGADFDLTRFSHRAVWNGDESRVEMHLVSRCRQPVSVPAAAVRFTLEEGETIWTESSYKYTREAVGSLAGRAGFGLSRQWVDEAAGFALSLFEAA